MHCSWDVAGRLNARVLRRQLLKYGIEGGARGRVHPHKLRHAFATHLLEGAPTCVRFKNWGHASVSTTQDTPTLIWRG